MTDHVEAAKTAFRAIWPGPEIGHARARELWAALEAMPTWNDPKVVLPTCEIRNGWPKPVRVIVAMREGVHQAVFQTDEGKPEFTDEEGCRYRFESVLAWMPMPEAP